MHWYINWSMFYIHKIVNSCALMPLLLSVTESEVRVTLGSHLSCTGTEKGQLWFDTLKRGLFLCDGASWLPMLQGGSTTDQVRSGEQVNWMIQRFMFAATLTWLGKALGMSWGLISVVYWPPKFVPFKTPSRPPLCYVLQLLLSWFRGSTTKHLPTWNSP